MFSILFQEKNLPDDWLAIAGPAAKEWFVRWRASKDAGRSEATDFRVGLSFRGKAGFEGIWGAASECEAAWL